MSARILVARLAPAPAELAPLLSGSAHAVRQVDGAAAALRAACAEPPDLVLLEVERPDEEALELVRALKTRSLPRFVPVLVLSTDAQVAARVAALRAGADDFLPRPFHPAEALARISAMLRIQAAQDRLQEQASELARLSVTDPLTGLHNRRHLQERLAQELSRTRRYGGPLALLLLDLDHFKSVNDRYGHQAGDAVLRGAAAILKGALRVLDVCARFGGEEFAVVMPATDWSGALTVAERLRGQLSAAPLLAAPALLGGGEAEEIRVTASFGVAYVSRGEPVAPEDLLRAADAALYRAKAQGRDATCLAPAFGANDAAPRLGGPTAAVNAA